VKPDEYRRFYDEAARRLEATANRMVHAGLQPADCAGLYLSIGMAALMEAIGEGEAVAWLRKAANEMELLPYKGEQPN
jgi:hypothetical protein